MALIDFTEAELAALREMARRILGGTVNVFGRSPSPDKTWEDHQAPEVYVAKPVESDGIPRLIPAAEDACDAYDTPGYEQCDIYEIQDTDSCGPALMLVDLEQRVYNISEEIIEYTWVLVTRDKSGRWIAQVPHGVHLGVLDDALEQGGSATMSIWTHNAGTLQDSGENLTVYDYFLAAAEEIALGKKVKAEFFGVKWYITAAEC